MPENREPVTPTVKIVIEGGIAHVTRKDVGVHLIIVDNDGKQIGEGQKIVKWHSDEQVGHKVKYTRHVI